MGKFDNDFSQKIQVDGLNDFLKHVKATTPEVANKIADINKKAADMIKDQAAANANALGSTAAKASGSLATSKAQKTASIRLGRGMPFAYGAEFGAKKYNQFKPWTGNKWVQGSGPDGGVGYFLYPAVRQKKEKVETEYMAQMLALMRSAGFEISDRGSL